MNGRTDQELLRRRQGEVALVAEAGDVPLVGLYGVFVGRHVRVALWFGGAGLDVRIL